MKREGGKKSAGNGWVAAVLNRAAGSITRRSSWSKNRKSYGGVGLGYSRQRKPETVGGQEQHLCPRQPASVGEVKREGEWEKWAGLPIIPSLTAFTETTGK